MSLPSASALPSVLLSVFSLTVVCIQGSPAVPGCWVIPARVSYSSPKCLCASTSTNHMDVWVRSRDRAATGSHHRLSELAEGMQAPSPGTSLPRKGEKLPGAGSSLSAWQGEGKVEAG